MGSFQTTDGATWTVSVNVGTVKRVREATNVNLLALISETSAISDVFADDIRLAEVIAAVVSPQIRAAKKTDDEFFQAMDGSVLESAAEALLREVANFFQEPRRSVLLKAMDKVHATTKDKQAAEAAAALELLEKMDHEIPAMSILTNSASNLQAPAA